MTPTATRETAKIYAFPVGGRLGTERRDSGRSPVDAKPMQSPATYVDCGYHEAALLDSDRSRKA